MTTERESLRRFAPVASGEPSGRAIVLGSGRGGSGTSSVAILVALAAADAGRSVLLVDADDNLGALHLLLGLGPGPSLDLLRAGQVAPTELLVPIRQGLQLLAATASGPEGGLLRPAERAALYRRAGVLFDDFDLVLVDGGSRLGSVMAACAEQGGRLVLVSDAARISVAAGYALVKAALARFPGLRVDVLANRCEDALGLAMHEVLRSGADQFLQRGIGYVGALPDDPAFRAATDGGTPIQELNEDCRVMTLAHELTGRLLHDFDLYAALCAVPHSFQSGGLR